MARAREVAAVEAFLARGGLVQGRLRERADGDVLDFPCGALPIRGGTRPETVLAALEHLVHHGVVTQSLAVHRFDSSEYIVTWHIAG